MAGEIAELGENVSDWQVGQRVVVDPGVSLVEDEYTRSGEDSVSPGYHVLGEHRRGGAAEYLAIPVKNLGAMPDDIDFPEAAAPLLVGLTAWRMLMHQAVRPTSSGASACGPLVLPTMTIRPPRATACMLLVMVAWPTLSTTTSTPRLEVSL